MRVAGLVKALAEMYDVTVIELTDPGCEQDGHDGSSCPSVPFIRIPKARGSGALRHFVHWQPRVGRSLVDKRAFRRITASLDIVRPRVVLFTHSYLAAVVPFPATNVVVDFPNIETRRFASLASRASIVNRISARWEGMKALVWEPRVARLCDLAVAMSESDAAWLRARGANAVVVPNGAEPATRRSSSPPKGPITFVSSATYGPNRDAGMHLLKKVWPRVRSLAPEATLCLVGRGTEEHFGWAARMPGVEIAGEVSSVIPFLEQASIIVAPVSTGGGQQLKIVEALAQGRVMVVSPYSLDSVPLAARIGCMVASGPEEFARASAHLFSNVDDRHRMEAALAGAGELIPTWRQACVPLAAALPLSSARPEWSR